MFEGSNDRLPHGGLVFAMYLALVAAALALASIGGWASLITIACLFATAIGYLARAASWATGVIPADHDPARAESPAAGADHQPLAR